MADNKKELERDELHKAIWNIANDLRGSVDGWDFKQYVLGIMFWKILCKLSHFVGRLKPTLGIAAK